VTYLLIGLVIALFCAWVKFDGDYSQALVPTNQLVIVIITLFWLIILLPILYGYFVHRR